MGVRPENCDPSIGDPSAKAPEKCPYCGQFHLRLGYCQALDPINAAQYPQWHQKGLSVAKDETLSQNETLTETLRACAFDECGKMFKPLRSTARFCSPACRLRAHRGPAE